MLISGWLIGPGPDVTETLIQRSVKRSSNRLPQSRSPFVKSNIGGTPRRPSSIGPRSSAGTPQTETRNSSHPRITPLDFSIGKTRSVARSIERSPRRSTPRLNGSGRDSNVYSQSPSPETGRDISHVWDGYENYEDEAEDTQQVNGGFDEPSLAPIDEPEETLADFQPEEPSLNILGEEEEEELAAPEQVSIAAESRRPRTRLSDVSNASQQDPQDSQDSPSQKPMKKPPGRPRKNVKKTASSQAAAEKPKAPAKGRKPGARKDPNMGMGQSNEVFKKPGIPRGNVRMRRQDTPMEDDGILKTRSGRISYKPLQAWKGEYAVFKPEEINGGVVDSITRFVRMEDVTPQKRKLNYNPEKTSQQPRRKKRKLAVRTDGANDSDEVEEVDLEPWETEEGVISGNVRMWDPELETGIDERRNQGLRQTFTHKTAASLTTITEIAFASLKIEPRENGEGSFRFAKTLTMPFFGSGVVELPPGGFKRSKNSRRMQMMFFVHLGKVSVEVAGTKFGISKGGVWQVPRGELHDDFSSSGHCSLRLAPRKDCNINKMVHSEEERQMRTGVSIMPASYLGILLLWLLTIARSGTHFQPMRKMPQKIPCIDPLFNHSVASRFPARAYNPH